MSKPGSDIDGLRTNAPECGLGYNCSSVACGNSNSKLTPPPPSPSPPPLHLPFLFLVASNVRARFGLMKGGQASTKIIVRLKPLVLPHQLIGYLCQNGHLEVSMDHDAYWKHMYDHASWGRTHPALQAGPENCHHLAAFLYGDDARYSKQEKLIVISLGLVLDPRKNSMLSYWPLVVIREASILN